MSDQNGYPGFPVQNPSLSFWRANYRSNPFIGLRTSSDLPKSVEVVISNAPHLSCRETPVDAVAVGSGLSGLATAYFLLKTPNPPASIVVSCAVSLKCAYIDSPASYWMLETH